MSGSSTKRVLDPIEGWFAQQGWAPFKFQREAWTAFLEGKSGLIHAATGTGKTFAAWLAPVWMFSIRSHCRRIAFCGSWTTLLLVPT